MLFSLCNVFFVLYESELHGRESVDIADSHERFDFKSERMRGGEQVDSLHTYTHNQ